MNRINNLKGSDIIVILIGVNDNVNGHTKENFAMAYDRMIKNVKKTCPDAYIFCGTLGYSAHSSSKDYYTEEKRIEFNDVIVKTASANDAVIIDFAALQTKDTYSLMLEDSFHLNTNGMEIYAEEAIKIIKNYVGA